MARLYFRAITNAFISSLFLTISSNVIFLLLDFKNYYYIFLTILTLGAALLIFLYSWNLRNILTKKRILIFSAVKFVFFYVFWFFLLYLDVMLPFDIPFKLSVRQADVSDEIGVFLGIIWFLSFLFVGCVLVLIRRIHKMGKTNKHAQSVTGD